MWQPGSPNYSDGSLLFSVLRKSVVAVRHEFSCDGIETSQLYCESKEIRQGELPPTESLHSMEIVATSSPLIISQICIQNWLGSSMEPLSGWDTLIIRLILLRTALQSFASSPTVVAALLASGMWIWRDLAKTHHLENSRQNVLSGAWHSEAFKYSMKPLPQKKLGRLR